MLFSLLKTLALMAALCTGWLLVQRLWLRAASPGDDREDALAGRSGCGNCGCDEGRCTRERDKPENREADDHAPGRL